MTLSVTVLGCSGTYAAPGGACSGYLLRTPTTTVVVDCGPGTLANLQTHVALSAVDAVVVTHEHPDHWVEVPVLRNALRYAAGVEGVPLYGTAGALGMAEAVTALAPTYRPSVLTDGDTLTVGDLTMRCSRTDHPVETLAVRAEHAGSAVGYTADTAADWEVAELGRDLDLVLAEATLRSHEVGAHPVHMSAEQAGRAARAAGARRLVVTHLLPGADAAAAVAEAAEAYGAPVEAAAVHATYAV